MKEKQRESWLAAAVITAGVFIRMGHLVAPHIDSDQAVFGLQALHVLKGEFPAFSWGYAYIGTLQSYIAAAFFYLFGPSRHVLNAVPLLFYIGYALALYSLTRSLFTDFRWRMLALALGALAPDYFIIHGAWARHGYPETYCFGTVMLALMCRNTEKCDRGFFYFWLFFTAGIAWWSNFLILYYFVPLAVFFVYQLCLSVLAARWVKLTAASLAGFVAGGLPFWIYNFSNSFTSFSMFKGAPAYNSLGRSIVNTIWNSFPVLVGARQYIIGWTVPVLGVALSALCGLALIFFALHRSALLAGSIRAKRLSPWDVILIFFFGMVLIFFKSGFSLADNRASIRYLLPFYSLYPVALAYFVQTLHDELCLRRLAFTSAVFVLVMNAVSMWSGNPFFHPFMREEYRSEIEGERRLFSFLESTGQKQFLMFEYWQAPKLTFDAAEKMIFAHVNERYPRYITDIFSSGNVAYLLKEHIEPFKKGAHYLGFGFSCEEIGGFLLCSNFRKTLSAPLIAIPGDTFRLEALRNIFAVTALMDRNSGTSYRVQSSSGSPHVIDIAMDKPRIIGGIALFVRDRFEAPDRVRITDAMTGEEVIAIGGACVGLRAGKAPYMLYSPPYYEMSFQPRRMEKVRISFETSAQSDAFSLCELVLMEETESVKIQGDIFPKLAGFRDRCRLVVTSIGAFQRTEEALERRLDLEFRKRILFDRGTLLVFEKEYLDWNSGFLKEIGVDFECGADDTFAWIFTRSASQREAVWEQKALLRQIDPAKADVCFSKAESLAGRNDGKAVSLLDEALYYLPSHEAARHLLLDISASTKDIQLKDRISDIKTFSFPSPGKILDAVYGESMALRGVTLSSAEAAPGDTIEILFDFTVLKRTKNDFAVFVYFLSPEGEILYQGDHFIERPSGKRFCKGERILDAALVPVPEKLVYKGPVSVWAGLWDPESGRRWEARTKLEDRANRVRIADITVK